MNSEIKMSYKRPQLFLCNTNKVRQAILTNKTLFSAFNIIEKFKVNETAQLTFSIPFENTKISVDDCEKLIKKGFEHYIIKNISLNSSNTRVMDITCEHESVELKGILCTPIDVIGVTASEMFNEIMGSTNQPTGYFFKGTDIDSSTKRHLQCNDERSVFENLVEMAKVFNGWLEFSTDSNGKKFIFLRKEALQRGKFVKKGNGLKSLDVSYSSDEVFTRLYAFGSTDEDGVELNIMGVNPTKKSYVENYDYYLAKGMTLEEILATPKCLQECIYRNGDIVDEKDLFRIANEEILKASNPILNGNISMTDLSVFEGNSLMTPIIGERITVLDKDIQFNIGATIVGLERNYDNPMDTKIEISNVIKYNSIFKDLIHQGEIIDKITGMGEDGKTEFHANFIKGIIDGNKAHFQSMIDTAENLGTISLLFECRVEGHDLYGAVGIGTKGVCCSDELDPKGEWIWKVGITGSGINATAISVGELNASLMKVGVLKSFNNKSWINMHDGTFNFQDKIKFVDNKFSIDLSGEGLVGQEDLDNLNAKIDITARDIRVEMTNVDKDLKSQINVNAEYISQKVSNIDFNSYKSQTASTISQKVTSGQGFSTEFNQNASGFNFALGDGNMNVNITKHELLIRNGMFTIMDRFNKKIFGTDQYGNIMYTGRLQPNDYIIRMFGDDCRIDGSNNNLRLQWDRFNYLSVGVNEFKIFSKNATDLGIVTPSMSVGGDGHFSLQCQGTRIKMLRGSSEIQCRDTYDSFYGRFVGSDFVNGSRREFKENIQEPNDIDFKAILMKNNIKQYNLKSDIITVENMPTVQLADGSNPIKVDKKLGLILEDITQDAWDILNPLGSEGISQYSMASVLWKVCQDQQTKIDEQDKRLKIIEDMLFASSKQEG